MQPKSVDLTFRIENKKQTQLIKWLIYFWKCRESEQHIKST